MTMLEKFILTSCVILLIALWIRFRSSHNKLWSSQGLGGPPAHLLLGNMLDYLRTGSPSGAQRQWLTHHSRGRSATNSTVGFFLGGLPALVTTNLDLIRRVCIKDFHLFADRQRIIAGFNPAGEMLANETMIFCAADKFGSMRQTINRCFTPAKLRGNISLIESAVKIFISKLQSKNSGSDQNVELKAAFGLFTCDVIARCAFGLDDPTIQSQQHDASKKPQLLKACDTLANNNLRDPFLVAAILFPGAAPLIRILMLVTYRILDLLLPCYSHKLQPLTLISKHIRQVARLRGEQQAGAISKRQDILQAMIDSQLSESEVAANGAVFYLAGYETTSTTLSFMMHYLVNDQSLQERLRGEAKSLLESDGKLDYNTLAKLPLLEAVMKETLRLHPPVTQFMARDSLVDYHYRPDQLAGNKDCGLLTIPKGTSVVIGMQQLHLDPTYWGVTAEDFLPERFLPDPITGEKPFIEPLAYVPFRAGPRNCVGQRFAMMVIKLTLASLLVRFRFVPCPRTHSSRRAEVDERNFVQHPAHGVWARIEEISI